jgi:hypothetical protein
VGTISANKGQDPPIPRIKTAQGGGQFDGHRSFNQRSDRQLTTVRQLGQLAVIFEVITLVGYVRILARPVKPFFPAREIQPQKRTSYLALF